MNLSRPRSLVLALLLLGSSFLQAQETLFIGNSYTYGGGDDAVKKFGGVPKMVETIATTKGKTVTADSLTKGGKNWTYHLAQPETDQKIASKKWAKVVLQDLSLQFRGDGFDKHVANAEVFYRKIRETSPDAQIYLYETWARGPKNPIYEGDAAGPEKMLDSIQKLYAASKARMEGLKEGEVVEVIPVGDAFALAQKKHPEIELYSKDNHHASSQGTYLAALVIYATLFKDTPNGATSSFEGVIISSADALALQQVAEEITAPSRAAAGLPIQPGS